MSSESEDKPGDTVRLLRPPPRVFTDPGGHNVWMGEVEVFDVELVQAESPAPYNSGNRRDPWSNT